MEFFIGTLGVTFVAFCVWLTVRLVNRGWKPGRLSWTVAAIALILSYPLSFGPACWWHSTKMFSMPVSTPFTPFVRATPNQLKQADVVYGAPQLYWPIGWMGANGPTPVSHAIRWYAGIGLEHVCLPINSTGNQWWSVD
jgi:hypothetical protein